MPRTLKEALESMAAALRAGERPQATPEEIPCFSADALAGHPHAEPGDLQKVLASLSAADIPTLEAAIDALAGWDEWAASGAGAQGGAGCEPQMAAWLGFKLVTDAAKATDSEDTRVVGIQGPGAGSADALPAVFVAYEDSRIVCSRPYSKRDQLQMLDVTRGPHMHSEQYEGVAWLSLPLERSGRVFIIGAGEVPLWVARYAHDVGFATTVLDYDAAYLTAERFPDAERVLLPGFADLPKAGLQISERDYVLVLTRGHMYDPEAIVYGIRSGAHFTGMMGCAMKNERVFTLAEDAGVSAVQLEATHSPVGLRFGAKTPPELAMCIVAELIQDRYNRRRT